MHALWWIAVTAVALLAYRRMGKTKQLSNCDSPPSTPRADDAQLPACSPPSATAHVSTPRSNASSATVHRPIVTRFHPLPFDVTYAVAPMVRHPRAHEIGWRVSSSNSTKSLLTLRRALSVLVRLHSTGWPERSGFSHDDTSTRRNCLLHADALRESFCNRRCVPSGSGRFRSGHQWHRWA